MVIARGDWETNCLPSHTVVRKSTKAKKRTKKEDHDHTVKKVKKTTTPQLVDAFLFL